MRRYLSLLFFSSHLSLYALPTEGVITHGSATLSSFKDEGILKIEADGTVLIDWSQFDLGPQEVVEFVQQQDGCAIVNWVHDVSAARILGRIQANCPILLMCSEGLVIGDSAVVSAKGLVASTAEVVNDLFSDAKPIVFEKLGNGKIVNLGLIAAEGADVVLMGHCIENQGTIDASLGQVSLITSEAAIKDGADPLVDFVLDGPHEAEEGIVHHGTIEALHVVVKTLSSRPYAVCLHGAIEASSAEDKTGQIDIAAEFGECVVDAGLKAAGGLIQMAAKSVHLTEGAKLDVSHQTAPGMIVVDPKTQSFRADDGACLFANALDLGNGGEISVVSQWRLSFDGLAEARGGGRGGDGGAIHLSCFGPIFELTDKKDFVNASAVAGQSGHVVFDPQYVTISSNGTDPAGGNTFSSNPSGSVVISGASLQAALDAANVTIQANSDIAFEDVVAVSTLGNGLTLQAGRSIIFNGQLTLNQGDFTASINDSGALSADRDAGAAQFLALDSSQIITQGGDILVEVGAFGGQQEGEVVISGATIDAGGGNVSMTGYGRLDGSDSAYGIMIGSNVVIETAGAGTITLNGTGGSGANYCAGVYLVDQSSSLQSGTGQIHVIGQGGGSGLGNGNVGVYCGGLLQNSSTGPILVDATGGNGVHGNMGLLLSGGQINAVDGAVTLNGTGGVATGGLNFGVRFEGQAQCSVSGLGAVTLNGISSTGGKNNNHGVIFSGGGIAVQDGDLLISGTGQGSQNYNYGVRFESESSCSSTGTATITVQGQSLSGVTGDIGVSISTSGIALQSGYGDILVSGSANGSAMLNQGVRLESGQVISNGTGANAAQIHLTGVGGMGTDYCNGVDIEGVGIGGMSYFGTVVTSVDGNITLEGTAPAGGASNEPIYVDPASLVSTTGSGTVIYITH